LLTASLLKIKAAELSVAPVATRCQAQSKNRGRRVVSYPLHGSSSQALKGAEQHMTLILAYPLDASNPTSLLDSCLRLL